MRRPGPGEGPARLGAVHRAGRERGALTSESAWRLLDVETGSPAWNMAVDEALLETGRPTLRMYRWRPAAISIGVMQSAADLPAELSARAKELVRRTTGGGAILHDEGELTWSVTTVMPSREIPPDLKASYRLLNRVLCAALAQCGQPADAAPPDVAYDRARAFDCFSRATELDVTRGGRKIAGAAQRRPLHRFLEHVSVPSPPSGLPAALVDAFCSELQVTLCPGALSEAETLRARALEREKYGAADWTYRR